MNVTESPKFAQMCRDYLTYSKAELDDLKPAIEKADFERIHQISHKIKGTSGAYQLTDVSKAAEGLQNIADNKDAAGLKKVFDELCELVENKLQSL
jgi:HPt (histidine-containing phosphotransfer) domain-containing protein